MTALALPDRLTLVDPADLPARVLDDPQVLALVDAARDGSRDAFGELVSMYDAIVFRTSLAALGRREDAEDAAQEAFVIAWQKLSSFRGQSTFRTWLLTIAWRKALDRRRVRTLWWTRTASRSDDDDPASSVVSNGASPEEHAVSRELARRIRREIAKLTPKIKDAFLLASSGDFSYEDISTMLGIPVGTVKWRVSEARRLLHERISR